MLSSISLARLGEVHPALRKRILQLDEMIPSVNLQISQGLRSWAQQNALYAQGRTSPGAIVTDVPAGYSAHNFGYAVDVVPEDIIPGQPDWNVTHPAWVKILMTAPSCGLAEGAAWRTFPDDPHLYLQELPAEPTDEMRAQFTDGGLMEVWTNFHVD